MKGNKFTFTRPCCLLEYKYAISSVDTLKAYNQMDQKSTAIIKLIIIKINKSSNKYTWSYLNLDFLNFFLVIETGGFSE